MFAGHLALLALISAPSPTEPCAISAADAVLNGVAVGATTVDIRGLDIVVTPSSAPGVAHVRTDDSLALSGTARGVTFRPRAAVSLFGGALVLGPGTQLVNAARASNGHLRADARVGYQLTVHNVRLRCADLVVDLQSRTPSALARAKRPYPGRVWHPRERQLDVTTPTGTNLRASVVAMPPRSVELGVVGRDARRARVVVDWGDGSLTGSVPRDQIGLGPSSMHVLSGGLLHSLAGDRCNPALSGRRGGTHIYWGAATLGAGTEILDRKGQRWATVVRPIEVEIDWDRREPRARIVQAPGIAVDGACSGSPEGWVDVDGFTVAAAPP